MLTLLRYNDPFPDLCLIRVPLTTLVELGIHKKLKGYYSKMSTEYAYLDPIDMPTVLEALNNKSVAYKIKDLPTTKRESKVRRFGFYNPYFVENRIKDGGTYLVHGINGIIECTVSFIKGTNKVLATSDEYTFYTTKQRVSECLARRKYDGFYDKK